MLIHLQNVYYQVPNGKTIYENLNLHVYEGDFIGVLGRNGAGKTTLIDFLMGHRPISSGTIQVLGEDPMDHKRKEKTQIFILSHDVKIQLNYSVQNYLDFMSFFYPHYSKETETELLKYFGIDKDSRFGSLSTGQKAKAQIVCAISSHAKLILIDEITAVLDPESRAKFFHLLKKVKSTRKITFILATNIAEDLNSIADKVLFIDSTRAQMYHVDEIQNLFQLGDIRKIA